MSPRELYEARVRELVDAAPPVSDATRSRLVDILRPTDPRHRLRAAAALRPDLPAGISRAEVVSGDG